GPDQRRHGPGGHVERRGAEDRAAAVGEHQVVRRDGGRQRGGGDGSDLRMITNILTVSAMRTVLGRRGTPIGSGDGYGPMWHPTIPRTVRVGVLATVLAVA